MNNNEIDLGHFKELLIELRSELEKESKQNKNSTNIVELDQSRIGRLSRMDQLQSQAMALETERRRKARLKKIEIALIN